MDQSAYSALESGGAQVVIGVTTVPIIKQAEKAEKVHIIKGTVASTLEMNSYKPPLNNPIAREAIEYAIDPQALLNINSPGFGQVVQDYIGPASPFYEKTVPGYKGYDLAKAKALVKQLGGHLTVQLQTLTSAANATAATALENQLAQAGITMTIKTEELTTMDNNLTPGNWQMVPGAAGGPDPDIGPQSLPTRFSSAGLYTCCKSSTLDKLINQTVEDVNPAQRLEAVHKAYAMIAKNDYVVPLYSTEGAVLYSPKIHGLTTVPSLINDVSWTQMTVGS